MDRRLLAATQPVPAALRRELSGRYRVSRFSQSQLSAVRKRIVENPLGSGFVARRRIRLPASHGGPLKRDRQFLAGGVECHLPLDAGLSTVPVSRRDPDFLSAELLRHGIPARVECGAWCKCPMGHKAPV